MCFGLGDYFMAALLAAARYSRGGFSPCLAVNARCVRVPSGSTFHLEPGTIYVLSHLDCTISDRQNQVGIISDQ